MKKWINLLPARLWFLLVFVACATILAIALYIQVAEEQEPCPLCISQRIAFILTGLICLAAAIHNPTEKGRKMYALGSAASALLGAGIALRHVWIQHLPPDEVPECGPGLSYVFAHSPFAETLKLMFSGTGDCAEISWTLLGLSIPEWSLMAFVGLAIICLLQFWNYPVQES